MAEAKKTTKAKTKKVEPKEKQAKHAADVVAETAPVEAAPEAKLGTKQEAPEPKAKAGKRSAKAAKEVEEKQTKEARKAEAKEKSETTKKPTPKARSKTERAGKKYREVAKLIEKDRVYDAPEAMALIVKTAKTKFDSTVELHVNLGVDPKQADQNVRATVNLPSGTGKSIRVAVFCETDDIAKAKAAGADIAGADTLSPLLDKEQLDFDVLIATPKLMPQLGKYARLLGPRGMMPNPKSGTVTADVASATKEAKTGKVEYRVDPAGIVHLGIGKVSFGAEKLIANFEAIMDSLRQNKPASLKAIYMQKVTLTTTMGPSVRVKA